jgi:hypothetical protein
MPDDYQVVWHGLSIGRIMKGTGSPNHAPQWWWECNAYGRLPLGGESGAGIDLYDCKARFKIAGARMRIGLIRLAGPAICSGRLQHWMTLPVGSVVCF